jgi:2-dehydropantoate 2-reductase
MHYFVFGAGAVGGMLGARLALCDHPVTFLARPHLAAAFQRQGLRITGDGPSGWLQHAKVITEPEHELQSNPPDVILLTVKAYDCEAAANTLQRSTGQRPIPVVSLLNGVGNEQTLADKLGAAHVIPATLTTAVQMQEPGVFQVERRRGLGLASGHPVVDALDHNLTGAGIPVRRYANAAAMKWSKVLTNIVSNASSAILGWPPAMIFAHKGVATLEIQALREAVRVIRRQGLHPVNLPGVPVAWLCRALALPASILRPVMGRIVASGRGDKLPSFNYDIARGRSEVEWLNGAVVRSGRELNVPTPANRVLTDTLLELVKEQREPAYYRGKPERLLDRARVAGVPGF